MMKRYTARYLLLTGFAMVAVPIIPVVAQTVPDRPDPAPPATTIEQIPAAPGMILTPPATPRTGAPPPQLADKQDSAAPSHQLTSERQSPPAPVQIYKGKRTAQPSQPLSRPADGRTGSVERVAGDDRCDPAASEHGSRECAAVIETRAAEFSRPDATPLSPEQRIIIAQQLRERAGTAGQAARLLAIGSLDADSEEAQEVASIVLRPPPAPPEQKKSDEGPTAEEQAAAIVNAIIGQQPLPPR